MSPRNYKIKRLDNDFKTRQQLLNNKFEKKLATALRENNSLKKVILDVEDKLYREIAELIFEFDQLAINEELSTLRTDLSALNYTYKKELDKQKEFNIYVMKRGDDQADCLVAVLKELKCLEAQNKVLMEKVEILEKSRDA